MSAAADLRQKKVVALVLAAGRGTRFGAGPDDSKVLALLDGQPLVRHVAEIALASRAVATLVVTGQAADAVAAALAGLHVRLVPNPDYASGMASSVKAGLAAVPAEVDGALVLLADMPRVAVATLDALIAAFEAPAAAPDAAVPVHAGQQGNPVLLGRALFSEVARLDGDAGARKLLPGRAVVTCAVDDPGIMVDVDTQDALGALSCNGRASLLPLAGESAPTKSGRMREIPKGSR